MRLKLLIICCILQSIAGEQNSNLTFDDSSLSSRIVGNSMAHVGQFPYMCSLQYEGKHTCGCVIVSTKYVLTAAQCFGYVVNPMLFEVLVGTIKWNSGGTRYRIQKTFKHPQFIGHTEHGARYVRDIGIIRILGLIKFQKNVAPIRISPNFVGKGIQLRTAGWGRVSTKGEISPDLKVLLLESVENKLCRQYFLPDWIHESHVCGVPYVKRTGMCNADWGGFLIAEYKSRPDDGWLVGISSWAMLCARGYPEVFSRITYVYDWMQKILEGCDTYPELDNYEEYSPVFTSSAFTASAHNPLFYVFVYGIYIISLGRLIN